MSAVALIIITIILLLAFAGGVAYWLLVIRKKSSSTGKINVGGRWNRVEIDDVPIDGGEDTYFEITDNNAETIGVKLVIPNTTTVAIDYMVEQRDSSSFRATSTDPFVTGTFTTEDGTTGILTQILGGDVVTTINYSLRKI